MSRLSLILPLVLVAVVAALWSPLLGDGLRLEDFPGHVAFVRVLSEIWSADPGTIPLWNGREYAGTSLVAAYLHPIGSLLLLSPFTLFFGAERGLEIGGFTFLLGAALGMYAWCLAWSRSRLGSALGALVYVAHPAAFGLVGSAGQIHQPVTLATLPLLFLAWSRLCAKPTAARAVVAAIASAFLLIDMQRFFIAMPFVVALSLAVSRRISASLVAAVAALAMLALLFCFPTLPLIEERSLLQWHSPEAIEGWRLDFSFAHLLQLVDRGGLFAPLLSALPAAKSAAPAGGWYQGVVALAFVVVGSVWVAGGPVERARRLKLAATVTCWPVVVALAFGPRALLPSQWNLALQLNAAGPEGWLAIGVLATVFALWAASLFWLRVELLARWRRRRWAIDAGLVALVLVLSLAAPFDLLARLVFVYDHIRGPAHFAFPMLGFLLGTAVALVAPGWERVVGTPSRAAAVFAAVAALHVVDVWPGAAKLAPAVEAGASEPVRAAFRDLADAPEGRILDVSGYSPLTDMLGAVEAERRSAWGWLAWTSMRHTGELMDAGIVRSLRRGDMESAARMAGLANVRFFSRFALSGGRMPESPALARVFRNPDLVLAENLRALPYAQFYPEIAWVSGPNPDRLPIVANLAQAGIASYTLDAVSEDPRPDGEPDFVSGAHAQRLAPQAGSISALPEAPRNVAAPCRVERLRDAEVGLRCDFTAPGYLVIAESWSPRWNVQIDGEDHRLLRLNHAFQGVAVRAGEAQLRFAYQASPLLRASLVVSAVSWLAVATFAAIVLFRRR